MSRVFLVKYLFLLFIFGFFASAVFLLPLRPAQAAAHVIISEVQIAGEKTADEFVELYNSSETSFDLGGYQLRRSTKSGSVSSLKVFEEDSVVPAGGSFLWAADESLYAPPFADATTGDALANDNALGLFTQSGAGGVLVDSLAWGEGKPFRAADIPQPNPEKKKSLTRDLATLAWSLTSNPTPTNSRGEAFTAGSLPPVSLPGPVEAAGLRLNEILPDPSGDESEEEFIELWNAGEKEIALENFVIKDASKTGRYVFPKGASIPGKEFLILKRPVFKFALNNTNETLSLLDPAGNTISFVAYEKTKKDVSLNFNGSGWRGSKHLTPGAPNVFNNAPETKERVPKKAYEDVAVEFQARGQDSDGESLKFSWNFGDGHKSSKEKTTHTYNKKGTYTVTLKTSDGSEDVVETFTLKVQAFPDHDLRIKILLPNPAGPDEDGEWIVIENREKKDVNLKGYGLATGTSSDKMTNHPVREDFILEGGSETRITRETALFSLPNKKGRMELRKPNGDVIDKAKYSLENSAEEDMMYFKEKGKEWAWKRTLPDATEPTPTEIESVEEVAAETTIAVPEATLPEEELLPETPELLPPPQVLGASTVAEDESLDVAESPEEISLSSLAFKSRRSLLTGNFFSDVNTLFNALLNSWRWNARV